MQSMLERLYARRRFGMRPGLEVERHLLGLLGNPQDRFGVIHVAGTNGKGSVCAMIDAVLRQMIPDVGLYTSPHLVHFNERIRVSGRPIEDKVLLAILEEVEAKAAETASALGQDPTFFECATAAGLLHFARAGVKVAILETGMGGRLDATNVVTPLLAVITRIGVEHARYLGDTLEAIAGEKAGIVKSGRPVVCAPQMAEVRAAIGRVAAQCKARIIDAGDTVSVEVVRCQDVGLQARVQSDSMSYGTVHLSMPGWFQAENLGVAVAALEVLTGLTGHTLDPGCLAAGLKNVRWRGRFDYVQRDPPVILDGAHNPDAASSLARSLKKVSAGRPVALVVGMCADKDASRFLQALSAVTHKGWVVPLANERTYDPAALAHLGAGLGMGLKPAPVKGALEAACRWAENERGLVCVTGSLFLVGEVLAYLEDKHGDAQEIY
jgi:dihydrofolate synthase/folylpolyglutamate synthase